MPQNRDNSGRSTPRTERTRRRGVSEIQSVRQWCVRLTFCFCPTMVRFFLMSDSFVWRKKDSFFRFGIFGQLGAERREIPLENAGKPFPDCGVALRLMSRGPISPEP